MRIHLFVTTGALLAVALLGPVQARTAKGKKYALLVGVTKYDSANFGPALEYTENDVEELDRALNQRWYRKAAAQGNSYAKTRLADLGKSG
jgi:hypothetical protein